MIKRMVKNKRGWLKILEVVIAITILSGVILLVYSGAIVNNSREAYFYSFHDSVLNDISIDDDLRAMVLAVDEDGINTWADSKVPENLDFKIKICPMTDPITPCNLDNELFITVTDKEIFVREILVVATLDTYNPQKVKMFLWTV